MATKPPTRPAARPKRTAQNSRETARRTRRVPAEAQTTPPRAARAASAPDRPTPPSSLSMGSHPSAARSGRRELMERLEEHTSTGPAMTGGDIDADWEGAYAVGDEAAGGDNPTPDQQIVDDIGKAIGVEYQDAEELKGAQKIESRDRKRWELDPASSEDYKERTPKRKR